MKFQKEFLNDLFDFVIHTCKIYSIDESHGLGHSMNVFYYTNEIFKNETCIEDYENIIMISSILHDMCDKKYMNEDIGLKNIYEFLAKYPQYILNKEIDLVLKIIKTMSYSKVKHEGFPTFDSELETLSYHIVREADLLAAYDFDRCVIFQMLIKKGNYTDSIKIANELFEKRVTKHLEHNLFITTYGKMLAIEKHQKINYSPFL